MLEFKKHFGNIEKIGNIFAKGKGILEGFHKLFEKILTF